MQSRAYTMANPGRLGSAALSVVVSGVMFGLLTTLGGHMAAGPGGPALTLLSASSFASEDSPASEPEELRPEPARTSPPAEAPPAEKADQPETHPVNLAAPGPLKERAMSSLASASLIAIEAGGAEGTNGDGRQTGPASAAPADAAAATGPTPKGSTAAGGSGDAYGRAVFARIKSRQSYAHELARDKVEGSVALAFMVDPRGRLHDERVAATSGNKRLDRIALDQLRNAAPFPAPPQHTERAFTIRLTYRPSR